LDPDPQVEGPQEKLQGEAQRLRVLAVVAADKLFARGL
jgi:hypothetical protein